MRKESEMSTWDVANRICKDGIKQVKEGKWEEMKDRQSPYDVLVRFVDACKLGKRRWAFVFIGCLFEAFAWNNQNDFGRLQLAKLKCGRIATSGGAILFVDASVNDCVLFVWHEGKVFHPTWEKYT